MELSPGCISLHAKSVQYSTRADYVYVAFIICGRFYFQRAIFCALPRLMSEIEILFSRRHTLSDWHPLDLLIVCCVMRRTDSRESAKIE